MTRARQTTGEALDADGATTARCLPALGDPDRADFADGAETVRSLPAVHSTARESAVPAPVERYRGERCSIDFTAPAPEVLVYRLTGYADAAALAFLTSTAERVIKTGVRPAIFYDLRALRGYDSQVRVAMTRWVQHTRDLLASFDLLVQSRIVAMGVSVANLALGGYLRPVFEVRVFDDSIAAATARARGGT